MLDPIPPTCKHCCHSERSGPIFSSAPICGASGRAARFVRPVGFAGVEVRFSIARFLCDESLFSLSSYLCALCVPISVIGACPDPVGVLPSLLSSAPLLNSSRWFPVVVNSSDQGSQPSEPRS